MVTAGLFVGLSLVAAVASQAAGFPPDLASLLILAAGPAASVWASYLLDRAWWFGDLSPEGKLLTVGAVTLLISLGATALQQFLVANPFISAAVDPYAKAGLFALSFLSTQWAHGRRTAKARAAERAAVWKALDLYQSPDAKNEAVASVPVERDPADHWPEDEGEPPAKG